MDSVLVALTEPGCPVQISIFPSHSSPSEDHIAFFILTPHSHHKDMGLTGVVFFYLCSLKSCWGGTQPWSLCSTCSKTVAVNQLARDYASEANKGTSVSALLFKTCCLDEISSVLISTIPLEKRSLALQNS